MRSPMQQADMEKGFRVARNVVRVAAGFFILLCVGALVKTEGKFYPAILPLLFIIPIYLTTVTRMRAHFDRANAEIAATPPGSLKPGDFSDEDESEEP
jgi:hypothetical protein